MTEYKIIPRNSGFAFDIGRYDIQMVGNGMHLGWDNGPARNGYRTREEALSAAHEKAASLRGHGGSTMVTEWNGQEWVEVAQEVDLETLPCPDGTNPLLGWHPEFAPESAATREP
jgi:hypothetical protein